MKNLLTFDAGRRGRTLGVPALAAGALVLLLLSLGSGQLAAMGPGLVAAPPAQGGIAPFGIGVLAADDVGIVKGVSKSWVVNGDWITYTLTISNGSTTMNNVVVTDNLPVALTDVISSGTQVFTPTGGGVLQIGTMAPSQIVTITISGHIDASYSSYTPIINVASVTATGDTNATNNTSTAVAYFWPFVSNLPLIFRTPAAPTETFNFSDNFTSKYTGWVTSGDGCSGAYDIANSVYRVTMTKAGSCIIWNNKFQADDRLFYGTFKVKVRRTSTAKELRYGFQFDTAADSSDATGTRWVLEAYPNNDSNCSSKPYFWLLAQKTKYDSDGDKIGHTDVYNSYNDGDVNACTTAIDNEKGHWNDIAAVRKGREIEIFLRRNDDHNSHDSELFTSVPQLASNEADTLGFVQMRLESLTSDDVTVEFDSIYINETTADPWNE